jgi:predicted translin family RNA/ssDNA-binding protein|tara:strand:+ start:66 stop:317 length:252 start_codon:yes stop_codon:yes gene_type:complete
MTSVTIRFHGVQEQILERILESGIAETKSEAIRMAVLKFGMDMGLLSDRAVFRAIQRDLGSTKRPIRKVLEEIERVKDETTVR